MKHLKRLFSLVLSLLMIFTSIHISFATNENEFDVSIIQNSYVYDGLEKQPEVTVSVNNTVIDSNEYTLTGDLKATHVGNYQIKVDYLGNTKTIDWCIQKTNIQIKYSNITQTSAMISLENNIGDHFKTTVNGKIYTTKVISLTKLDDYKKYSVIVEDEDGNYYTLNSAFTTLPNINVKTPTFSSIKAGKEMAQLKWKKTLNVTGYEIYRSTSKTSGYKLVKTITSQTTLSYTNFLLTKNKVYYYKIRAYRTYNNKKYYGSYSSIKSVKPTASNSKTYYLRVNIKTNCTTVYALDFNGKYKAVKAFATSCGKSNATKYILGTHYTMVKYRWKFMHEDCYTQYATRIVGHYLFHSVPYSKAQPNTLWYNSYNKLGNFASSGCVRLNVAGSKWIYDHCAIKTKVVVIYSDKDPLKKPVVAKIDTKSPFKRWDPTDPDPKNPWKTAL